VNDELQWRINEHVLNGDAPSIIWAMEGQIRMNTELEAKLAELERREALYERFVGAADEWTAWCVCCMDEYESQFTPVMKAYDHARGDLSWLRKGEAR
jgi:hypothetical protein